MARLTIDDKSTQLNRVFDIRRCYVLVRASGSPAAQLGDPVRGLMVYSSLHTHIYNYSRLHLLQTG